MWVLESHHVSEISFVAGHGGSSGYACGGVNRGTSDGQDDSGPGDGLPHRGFREAAGDRFLRGIVLYGGSETLTFGEDVWALPVSALWSS